MPTLLAAVAYRDELRAYGAAISTKFDIDRDSGMGARSRKGAQLEILLDLRITVLGPWAEDILRGKTCRSVTTP